MVKPHFIGEYYLENPGKISQMATRTLLALDTLGDETQIGSSQDCQGKFSTVIGANIFAKNFANVQGPLIN